MEDLKEMKEQQYFSLSKNLKKKLLTFHKILQQLFKLFMIHIIMETQKIANLIGNADIASLKFAARKWCVINDQSNTGYGDR